MKIVVPVSGKDLGSVPLNEVFERVTSCSPFPLCHCGAYSASRLGERPWRCVRGHFIKNPMVRGVYK